MIKRIIRSTPVGKLLISELHCVEAALLPKLISDEKAVKRYYKRFSGKELDLSNPISFDEKLNWYKLKDRKPLMQQCADKVGVRDYVMEKGYGYTLNKVYGVYERVSDVDINNLPDSFVIKAAHGSHMNVIVKDKSQINWAYTKLLLNSWLHQDIAWSAREWCYKDVPKRLIIEKYVETQNGPLMDYKFLCFNGEPKLFLLDVDRFNSNHYRNYYFTDWTLFPYHDDVPNRPEANIRIPTCYNEMLKMAGDLSKPFQHARVDLYDVDGKIMFGEITFFQNGGNTHFVERANIEIGEMWELVKDENPFSNC